MSSTSVSRRRVLVTGGAGFIGSHLVEHLLDRGDAVVVLDNFDSTYDPNRKRLNLEPSRTRDGFCLLEGDIRTADDLDRAFATGPFDAVVHLAARAGVRPSILDPSGYDSVNIHGTTCLLDAVRRHEVPHLVLASSSSVYGATSHPPFSESQPADRPSSPYASTKRANELAAYAHHHLYGTTVACLRFFTVYGPRQRPEMAIHHFARLIDDGRPVPLFGDGSSRRDYTYVADVVRGITAAMDRPRGYRIYNLGTTSTIALNELVHKLGHWLERDVVVEHHELQSGDVPLTHADISLAAAELDYAPTVTLDDGLAEFVSWFRTMRSVTPLHAVPEQDRVIDLTSAPTEVAV